MFGRYLLLGSSGPAPDPMVMSVSPVVAPTAGGTPLSIVGTNFRPGATATACGVPLTSVVVTPTLITGITGAGSFSAGGIIVTNSDATTSGLSGVGLFGYYVGKDLLSLADGTHANLSAIGLVFSRADTGYISNQMTLRDSSSTVIKGIAADVARVFNDGTHRGLLMEQAQHNYAPHARNIASGWNATFHGTQTGNVATGPDGAATSASRITLGLGQVSNNSDLGSDTAIPWTLSSMQRSAVGASAPLGDMQSTFFNLGATSTSFGNRATSSAWGLVSVSKGTNLQRFAIPCDAYSGTSQARDIYVDFMQLERGDFATSCILGGVSVQRNPDYVSWASFPSANNRIRVYLKFQPLFSSSSQVHYLNTTSGLDLQQQGWYLYESGTTQYIYVNASDKKVYCRMIALVPETVSTNAIAFSQWDIVEMLIELGNGGATTLKYRLNAGSWTDLVMVPIAADATPLTDASFLASPVNGSSCVTLPCLFHEVRSYPVDITTSDI